MEKLFRERDIPDQDYYEEDVPYIMTYLSPNTMTGRNAFYLVSAVQSGKIKLKDFRNMTNSDFFPDIYLNRSLDSKEISYLESIRYSELEMVMKGSFPILTKRYAFGYHISDAKGRLHCGNKSVESDGLIFAMTYDEMVRKLIERYFPYKLAEAMIPYAKYGIKILKYKIENYD